MRMTLYLFLLFTSACSAELNIEDIKSTLPNTDPLLKTQRETPDFIAGEIVTTGNGVIVKGTFGELSEEKTLDNGVFIKGAFYE